MDNGASSYRRYLAGDDNGIVEVIREFQDGLMLFLNRYVKNIHIAEELTEDTFFKLVTKKPRFTENSSFKTWLYAIGRNLARNYIKHNSMASETSIDELALYTAGEDSIERRYLSDEQKLLLYEALSQIRSEYATVLHLKYFEDMTNAEIARVMKKNKRQVENMLYQAKQTLKTQLERKGFSYEEL